MITYASVGVIKIKIVIKSNSIQYVYSLIKMPTKECQKCCDHDAHTDKINNIIMTSLKIFITFYIKDKTKAHKENCPHILKV